MQTIKSAAARGTRGKPVMKLRVKVMLDQGVPVAYLCNNDSRINYWNEPGDASIELPCRDRWNSNLPGIRGGQYESVTTAAAVADAVIQFETLTGQTLDTVICASMTGCIE